MQTQGSFDHSESSCVDRVRAVASQFKISSISELLVAVRSDCGVNFHESFSNDLILVRGL